MGSVKFLSLDCNFAYDVLKYHIGFQQTTQLTAERLRLNENGTPR